MERLNFSLLLFSEILTYLIVYLKKNSTVRVTNVSGQRFAGFAIKERVKSSILRRNVVSPS